MAEPVPAGSDASAGSYDCTNCGYRLDVQSTKAAIAFRHCSPQPG